MANGEVFDVELQEIGIFGTPWHGKVQGGILTLPNAAEMSYTQPSDKATRLDSHNSQCTYFDAALAGTSHLIAIPDLPAVTRTTEEQESDTAAGRQWKTTATLSGGRLQLYGHNVRGWIYVDPDGDRWLVSCDRFWPYPHLPSDAKTTALNATIRLTRFGIIPIGGDMPAPEYYDHAVSLAAGWLTADSNVNYLHPTIDAVSRTGNKAAVGIHTGFGEVEGYIEVSISGAGSSATVAITVLRSFAQCAEYISNPQESGGIYDALRTASDEWSFSRLLAVWYDDENAVVEARAAGSGTFSATLTRDLDTGSTEYSYDGQLSVSIDMGGVSVDTVNMTAGCSEVGEGGLYSGESSMTADGQTFTLSWSDKGTTQINFAAPGVSPGFLGASGGGETIFVRAIGHSRHCVGFWTENRSFTEGDPNPVSIIFRGRPVATPAGVRGSVVVLGVAPSSQRRRDWALNTGASGWTSNDAFGAWDPLTGEVVLWQSTPVCFV